jgi:flavodoxin
MTTGKALIAFYSHTGNTTTVARKIQELTGGDLFQIETKDRYPSDISELVGVAKNEARDQLRPGLKTAVERMETYSVVYLGFPIWCGTMPMGVLTFLESYDFAGKTIAPFCTHAGGGMGSSEEDLERACPNSTFLHSIAMPDLPGWVKTNRIRK